MRWPAGFALRLPSERREVGRLSADNVAAASFQLRNLREFPSQTVRKALSD
jgi:hypothetical protein